MRSTRRSRATGTVAGAIALVLGGSMAAWAAGPGVGDVSDAMRYDTSAPYGSVVAPLSSTDDGQTTVAAPFAMNFFGEVYNGLCITTNGAVFPVVTPSDTCTQSYDKPLEAMAADAGAPMIAALGADISFFSCVSNLDDGFGVPCEVYFGTATIDGRDAVVITWYRVPMIGNANDATFDNTFQIVLIKSATGSDVAGWDFTFEFNYGQIKDAEEGYSAADPTNNCSSSTNITDCRWAIGTASYDSGTSTAVGYEMFPNTSIDLLADGGSASLTANSLNSAVLGRYTFQMVAGAVSGFSVPTMNGTPNLPAAPAAPAAVDPSLAETGGLNWRLLTVGLALIGVGVVLVTRKGAQRA